ncbi:hypothetical protein [Citrobacter koseri]|uniref:hypothetical protein n=1 Tax=Citrobacter koseri TaxID=545 RepID=UPI0028BEEED3|nr:hypothetical protein [Citrobacter koseri]MDT7450550.1 hypothetical protein [Citrobacter koseri]
MIELLKGAIIINKSFDNTLEDLDYTKVVLNFYRRNHYINSLFYENITIRGSKVYGDIKNENRKALIANLVQSIHLDLTQNSIRESKLSYELSRFIQFIRWCDSNNLHGCLDNDIQCIDAFGSYVDYHWERVTARKYKSTTAFNVLNSIKRILGMIIQPSLLSSLPTINFSHQSKISTTPPDDQRAAENVQLLLTFLMEYVIS